MLFCQFICQLLWYVVRNIVCAPINALVCAWEDAWTHYSFKKSMRQRSASQKRPKKHHDDTPPVRFICDKPDHFHKNPQGPVQPQGQSHKKRHRRGHRGGRKHHKKESR